MIHSYHSVWHNSL